MVLSANPTIGSKYVLWFILWICLSLSAHAQTNHQKAIFWQFGAGNTYLYDHYLSPLPYSGMSFLFSSGSMKPLKWGLPDSSEVTFDNAKWFRQFCLSINPVYAQSNAGLNLMHGNIEIRHGILREVVSKDLYHISVGAFSALGGGGRYCVQNGNNPGSIDALLDVGLTVYSDYKLTLGRKSVKLSYQGSMALAGLAFSPEYAESFYEIFYLRNYHNNLKVTSLNNMRHWRQQLNLDIPVSGQKSSLRLSYWNEGRISLLNHIRTRVLSNHFSVGYIRYFKIL
ncbi:MAG: hypothetical protein PHS30_00015 [Bacteroidales bacterium]|nr:hypothetical protein [Bacteroidales bacterium]